jgi:hypothetical protein
MTRPAEFISSLAAELGQRAGLERIVREIGELSAALATERAPLSRAQLAEVRKALETLGQRISEIDREVRGRIAALAAGA